MSDIFHKSCYTSRSSGYKYRTLSTNTGEKKRRDSREDNLFDMKFRELRRAILSRVDKGVDDAQKARDAIKQKSDKIHAKIDSMIELQSFVGALRKNLRVSENILADLVERVDKLDSVTSEEYSLRSMRSTFRYQQPPITEEDEDICSTVTHI